MRQTRISIDVAETLCFLYCSSGLLAFCQSVTLLAFVGHQDMKLWWIKPLAYLSHTRFHYSKLLTSLSRDCCSLSNISGMDLGGSGYRQILIRLCVKNILATKSECSGCMLASGWLPV